MGRVSVPSAQIVLPDLLKIPDLVGFSLTNYLILAQLIYRRFFSNLSLLRPTWLWFLRELAYVYNAFRYNNLFGIMYYPQPTVNHQTYPASYAMFCSLISFISYDLTIIRKPTFHLHV